ncbi:PfkB family carbohydrate kinase [Leptolyngbya sp. BC1307]|uniref:PfkB family carbohydrate kinase n=1 Tax=Leptolyngbya sp. BC1307 TaxID=2029589 RepID=UPI000EFAC45D|nr:PfkB family carbohydrate kinase [Leptolyngbya sp. BC1307]
MNGLFIGLTTLDCLYQADHPPAANEKVVAAKSLLVAGGPATNAAVAFAHLGRASGHKAMLASVLGEHSLTSLLREDLRGQGVTLLDLDPAKLSPPPVSSIVVTAATGDRSVISHNAAGMQVKAEQISPDILTDVDIVLIDGHQMAVGAQVAQWAKASDIPVVVDAGSWKPGFETVLAWADVAIASANFLPPHCLTTADVQAYLKALNVPKIAITRGAQPIDYADAESSGEIEIPSVRAVDTLGAGDIFHGAFCHFYLAHTFTESLLKASRSASFACQYWGTRDWTKIYQMVDVKDEGKDEASEK